MDTKQKEQLILDFIEGPLRKLLTGDISFSKFKELTNEVCETNFNYSDLYPSYLFNAEIVYPSSLFNTKNSYATEITQTPPIIDDKSADFNQKMKICHAYGLCIQRNIPVAMWGSCGVCPRGKNEIPYKLYKEEDE
jgi:hypothetical protein